MDLFMSVILMSLFAGVHGTGPTHGRRVICFLDIWSINNDLLDIETVEQALDKCTHFIVMYAVIDTTKYHLTSKDPVREIDLGGYKRLGKIREKFPHLKFMISVGGYHVQSKTFSAMCANNRTRRDFVESSIQFLRRHSFDGLEIRWFYPGDNGGTTEDGKNLVLLAKELRQEFDKNGLIFSIATPQKKRIIEEGADVKELSHYAHFLNILTWKYHDAEDGQVGVIAPLFSEGELSMNWSINYYLKMGVDPEKINLGLSADLASYTTKNKIEEGNHLVGLRVISGFSGPRIGHPRYMAYFETCNMQNNPKDWKIIEDEKTKTPFAIETNKNRIVSLETEETFALKVQYAMEKKLGGVHFFGLDKDDFHPFCKSSKVKYPLLSSIDRTMHEQSRFFFNDIFRWIKRFNSHYFWSGLIKN